MQQKINDEAFPFPWPPGQDPADDPRVQAIAQAAQELVAKRGVWLNREPPGRGLNAKELQKRTLTNLYFLAFIGPAPLGLISRTRNSMPRFSLPMAGRLE